jgi:hypothetical protein
VSIYSLLAAPLQWAAYLPAEGGAREAAAVGSSMECLYDRGTDTARDKDGLVWSGERV